MILGQNCSSKALITCYGSVEYIKLPINTRSCTNPKNK